MPPKRKSQKAAPKRKAQKKNGLFFEKSFYYPKDAPNFKEITDLIKANDGIVVTQLATAQFHLIPSGWAHKYRDADGDLYDVSFVTETVKSGELQDSENYIVSDLLPIPAAWQNRGERGNSRSPNRSRSANATPQPRHQSRSPNRNQANAERSPSPNRPRTSQPVTSPFPRRTLAWPRKGIDRFEDPIPLRGRKLFSHDDDMRLVGYILKNRGGYSANGNNLWKDAAAQNLIDGRTWQALQGRYKKTLRFIWDDLLKEYERWSER